MVAPQKDAVAVPVTVLDRLRIPKTSLHFALENRVAIV